MTSKNAKESIPTIQEKDTLLEISQKEKEIHPKRDIFKAVIEAEIKNRQHLVITCIVIQGACLLLSYVIIFLTGFKYMEFEQHFLKWLLSTTLVNVISNSVFVYKNIFPKKKS